jgi:cobalt-zinc-cadmium efflux system outer membrane protein
VLLARSASAADAEEARSATAPAAASTTLLHELVTLARERAPEVILGRSALTASRASYAAAALAPLGNPALEVKVDHGTMGVTKDVTVDASLWLPVELAGEKPARRREARDYVGLHQALLEQARAVATSRTLRAFGALAVATARVRVVEELLGVARAEAAYYAQRLAAGDTTERDAALASLEAARNEALLSETHVDILEHAGELAELTGRNVDPASPLDETPPAFAPKRSTSELAHGMPAARVLEAQARYAAASAARLKREAYLPLSFGLTGGRGDYGEARIGGGIGYTWPLFRANVPERARAEAERRRSLDELGLRQKLVARRIELLEHELVELGRTVDIVTHSALPAATRAVQAAVETNRAGKGDWLTVLVSRRDLSALSLRRLELLDRNWLVLADLVAMTGELP